MVNIYCTMPHARARARASARKHTSPKTYEAPKIIWDIKKLRAQDWKGYKATTRQRRKMTKTVVTRIKYYKKSGARLYIPEAIIKDPNFPFEDDDIVKIEIKNPIISISRPEWWEMLDWKQMRDTYIMLPETIKKEIQKQGLAPE